MLRGLFLAGLLSASTSTVSSIVNAHAATFYLDIVSPYINMSESTAVQVMRILAMASGTIMTLFAIIVPYLGTATRLFISLYTSAAGPFAGLVLLAISSPWVNAKGVTWACLLVCSLQLWHGVGRGLAAIPPLPVITGTMERCPLVNNATDSLEPAEEVIAESLPYVFPLYRLSYYWMALCGELLTIILGTAFSLLTGGAQNMKNNLHLTSVCILNIWRRFKFFRLVLQNHETNSGDGKEGATGKRGDECVPLTDFTLTNGAKETIRMDGATDSECVEEPV